MKTALSTAGALALFLFLAVPGAAQQATESGAGQPSEGIQVHGHWTVEIYEGDVLVERYEFENALTAEGAARILSVLAGTATPGPWQIGIAAEWVSPSGTVTCPPFEIGYQGGCFPTNVTAAVSLPTSGENAGGLVLEQSFENTEGTLTISEVRTGFLPCDSATAPDDCTGLGANTVTATSQSISAEQNQTVQIQVVITLS